MFGGGLLEVIRGFFLKILFIYFLDRGEGRKGRKRGKETSMRVCGYLLHTPGMCPDWVLNQQSFVSQAGTQSTKPHQPGLITSFR